MPEEKRQCTEVLNEIISRYSKVAFEKNSLREENHADDSQKNHDASEDVFWAWFCGEMKDSHFKECFLDESRDDFYGSLKTVRREYKNRCK